jgi:hypothetical protein
MTAARERLPDRRANQSFTFELNGLRYHATISCFADGRVGDRPELRRSRITLVVD